MQIFAPHSIYIVTGRGSSYQWTHVNQKLQAGSHKAWVRGFGVAGVEFRRCGVRSAVFGVWHVCIAYVPELGNSVYLGSYEFVSI